MKFKIEIDLETKTEILLDWVLNDPDSVAEALGPQYRSDLMQSFPLDELIEATENRAIEVNTKTPGLDAITQLLGREVRV